jgi:hypothetical protein
MSSRAYSTNTSGISIHQTPAVDIVTQVMSNISKLLGRLDKYVRAIKG